MAPRLDSRPAPIAPPPKMPHYADPHYPSSHSSLKPPSRQSISGRRSTASLRSPSTQANGDLDGGAANGRHHSLAHELAVALMPEPSAGSKLLAEEFGIEFDEGAEGIDDDQGAVEESDPLEERHFISDEKELLEAQLLASSSDPRPSFADELSSHDSFAEDEAGGANLTSDESFGGGGGGGDLDPVFDSPSTSRARARQRTPEKDAMDVLSENLEFTEKFITHLRTLDTESGTPSSQQPKLERLASDVIRRMNESVRERESQVRDLLEYEREFRKIGGEVGGSDVLGQLDELEGVDELNEAGQPTSSSNNNNPSRSLHTLLEEEPTTPTVPHRLPSHLSSSHDWELDPDKNHLGDADYESEPSTSPMRAAFPSPPTLTGAPTPAKLIPQLTHIRSFTSSTVSSLSSISEHAQVNGVATADAGRKIRSLKNKLGNWKTEWESAERSRAKIERWEAGIVDVEGSNPVATPTRLTGRRVDGRKLVQEQLKAFELALADAAVKTQAIMAR